MALFENGVFNFSSYGAAEYAVIGGAVLLLVIVIVASVAIAKKSRKPKQPSLWEEMSISAPPAVASQHGFVQAAQQQAPRQPPKVASQYHMLPRSQYGRAPNRPQQPHQKLPSGPNDPRLQQFPKSPSSFPDQPQQYGVLPSPSSSSAYEGLPASAFSDEQRPQPRHYESVPQGTQRGQYEEATGPLYI